MNILQQFSLEGKTAMVTGAAKTTGLCYGMASALHDAGAAVALLDVSDEVYKLAEDLGGAANRYHAVKMNLCDKESRNAGFNKALELLGGRVDILLNGAGIQFRCDANEFPEEKWEQVININLNSMFYMCQQVFPVMEKQGGGKIINIASLTSFNASRRIAAYAASKGGVAQMTKALSNEWAPKNILVNAIAPGYMATELTKNMIDTDQGKAHTARIARGRWGTPDDLKGATVFLASAASDYVSGAIIAVDGGYLAM